MKCNITGYAGTGGSIGSTVFAKNQNTYTARARKKPRYYQSPALQNSQQSQTAVANLWSSTVTPMQKAAWQTWAGTNSYPHGLPPYPLIDGYYWYIRAGRNTQFVGLVYPPASDPTMFDVVPVITILPGSYYSINALGGQPYLWLNLMINCNASLATMYYGVLLFGRYNTTPPTPNSPSKFRICGNSNLGFGAPMPGVPFSVAVYDAGGIAYEVGGQQQFQVAYAVDMNVGYRTLISVPIMP